MNNEINHEINNNKIKIKRKRCPKGQRRYPPKTGECIDKALDLHAWQQFELYLGYILKYNKMSFLKPLKELFW